MIIINKGDYDNTDANGITITDSGGQNSNELLGKLSYTRFITLLSLLYTVMCNMNTIMLSGFCQCYGGVHIPGSIEFHGCLVCHSEKETM